MKGGRGWRSYHRTSLEVPIIQRVTRGLRNEDDTGFRDEDMACVRLHMPLSSLALSEVDRVN